MTVFLLETGSRVPPVRGTRDRGASRFPASGPEFDLCVSSFSPCLAANLRADTFRLRLRASVSGIGLGAVPCFTGSVRALRSLWR